MLEKIEIILLSGIISGYRSTGSVLARHDAREKLLPSMSSLGEALFTGESLRVITAMRIAAILT